MATSDLFILAVPAVLAAGGFYLAGALTKRRMREGDAASGGFLNDLRGLEDAFVDFFGSSKTSAGILTVLATRKGPIGFKALAAEVRGKFTSSIRHDEMPLTAIRAVMRILLFSRLARMSVKGFLITELGREVYRRMNGRGSEDDPSRSNEPSEAARESLPMPKTVFAEGFEDEENRRDSAPWIGKHFEDPWVAAAIGEVEERFGERRLAARATNRIESLPWRGGAVGGRA